MIRKIDAYGIHVGDRVWLGTDDEDFDPSDTFDEADMETVTEIEAITYRRRIKCGLYSFTMNGADTLWTECRHEATDGDD